MLLLKRRRGEAVMIGDDVTVTILEIKGRQVRMGIKAPKNVAVHREEIYNAIQREKSEKTALNVCPAPRSSVRHPT